MYAISSLRFILLVAGQFCLLIADAFLRKSATLCFALSFPVNPRGRPWAALVPISSGPPTTERGTRLGAYIFSYMRATAYGISPMG